MNDREQWQLDNAREMGLGPAVNNMHIVSDATPDLIIGQLVGDGGHYIAIATATGNPHSAYLLATRINGSGEYVTWAYEGNAKGDKLVPYLGHYFHPKDHGGPMGAFLAAVKDLAERENSS